MHKNINKQLLHRMIVIQTIKIFCNNLRYFFTRILFESNGWNLTYLIHHDFDLIYNIEHWIDFLKKHLSILFIFIYLESVATLRRIWLEITISYIQNLFKSRRNDFVWLFLCWIKESIRRWIIDESICCFHQMTIPNGTQTKRLDWLLSFIFSWLNPLFSDSLEKKCLHLLSLSKRLTTDVY